MEKQRITQSFKHAFQGIWASLCGERNLKIHLGAAIIALFMVWWLKLDANATVLVILVIAGVFALELLNTAIEAVIDLISPEYHPLAKQAKDAAAGAVLIMAVAAVAVGYILFVYKSP